jgi:cellulose synthase/poly-beta-1,6-N-acetylglucosamine synthase-like glycosyltransferase
MALRALFNVAIMAGIVAAVNEAFSRLAGKDSYLYWLLALFAWRYLRFFVNLVAFWCYSASSTHGQPPFTPSKDVTAIIPTVAPDSADIRETLRSCADNRPAKIIIVTPGAQLLAHARRLSSEFSKQYPSIQFLALKSTLVSKRVQVATAVPHIKTDIAVLLDDHVFWGPRYLESILVPFADQDVGLVGTNKRVLRLNGLNLWGRIWNMLGATYLCRHNFEIRATNTLDGGVFVVSGRTCALRTEILQHPEFLPGYTNERFFFGLFGPLNPDDDNYITRFAVRHGWKIKIQYNEDTVVETKLGVEKPLHTKFLAQCRRWVRTTWRSNLCSLITDRTVWALQPYCVYAVYLTSLTNFAAITDPLLVYLFVHSSAYTSGFRLAGLVCWILFTKTVKVFDYFRRNPRDIILFPVYVFFAYFHSLIKFWALLTFCDCTWCGRELDKIPLNKEDDQSDSDSEAEDYFSEHPHVAALRAIRGRLTALQRKHAQHVKEYQNPVLNELAGIQSTFWTLHDQHKQICDNLVTIQDQLREASASAEQAGATEGLAADADADITRAIDALRAAVEKMEEKFSCSSPEAAEKLETASEEDCCF